MTTQDHDQGVDTDYGPQYLHLVRPRCPACQSVRLGAYRSVDNGDETRTKYARCKDCGRRVVIIVE